MRRRTHRLEVYLPKQYNPDAKGQRRKIPIKLIEATRDELIDYLKAKGSSSEFLTRVRVSGEWQGITDRLMVIKIDTKLRARDFEWLAEFKKRVEKRLKQDVIYILYYDITIIGS